MYSQKLLKTIDIFDCHFSEISCILLISFVLFYHFLVRHNRMLNPCYKVKTIGINIQDSSIKDNVLFRNFKWIPFKEHHIKIEPK